MPVLRGGGVKGLSARMALPSSYDDDRASLLAARGQIPTPHLNGEERAYDAIVLFCSARLRRKCAVVSSIAVNTIVKVETAAIVGSIA